MTAHLRGPQDGAWPTTSDGDTDPMLFDVLILPLRLGAFATRLGFRVVVDVVGFGLSTTERLVESAVARPAEPAGDAVGDEASRSVVVDVEVAREPSITETPSTPTAPAEPAAPRADTAPDMPPEHVSREDELVEAFADPGAEEGVGATVTIDEPWAGYAHMTANDVIARLPDASPEELAAIELYEHAHRDRKSVLAAANRELRRATAVARSRARAGGALQ